MAAVLDGRPNSLWRRDREIFLVSVLILYLELALIRWVGTEIRVFAFFGNLLLVVCFFGVGFGCYLAARPASLVRLAGSLLLVAVLVSNPLHLPWLDLRLVSYLLAGFEDSPIYTYALASSGLQVVGGLVIVGVLMYGVAMVFVPAGQMLGRALQEHPRLIHAYSVNIAGSLVGIWLFNALSMMSLAPPAWFGTAAVVVALIVAGSGWRGWAAVVMVAAAAGAVWLGRDVALRQVWSPYQKLTISPLWEGDGTNSVQQGYHVEVNDVNFQDIMNCSDAFLGSHPDIFDPELVKLGQYNLPFRFRSPIKRMLIVGAGTGNDAAAAVRHDVEQVDAVEIDPQIYALGRELHPEKPYDSPRVHVIVDDARAFFKHATGRYDMIWFAFLDSHTLGSSYNNLRLDHYVYTIESLQEAKRLLAQDGLLVLCFGAERRWIADRLYVMVEQVFGHAPLAYSLKEIPKRCAGGGGNCTLLCAHTPVTLEAIADPSLRELIRAHLVQMPRETRPTTDDWPYLYLQRAKIPKLYLVTSLSILGTVALARRRALGLARGIDWPFFWLGAAFLLLEVQTVSRATLLFGMTWVVNAIVISAVLVMILLANLVASRWTCWPEWLVAGGLFATIAAIALVPLDWFNALSGLTKLVAASAFLTAPVFFAGLIFIRAFAACADKAHALGSNLIGALVGGLLESLSFVTGMRALVVLVGLFYAIAILARRRGQPRAQLPTAA